MRVFSLVASVLLGTSELASASPMDLHNIMAQCGNETVVGDVNVTPTALANGEFSHVRCVVGTVTLSGEGELSWPSLWRVYGHLQVVATRLNRISLPILDEVWLRFSVLENPMLAGIDLPKFGSLNARGEVRGNSVLSDLNWYALGAINGRLTIANNKSLQRLKLNALGGINGRLEVRDNPVLRNVQLDSLGAVHGSAKIFLDLRG